MNLIKNKSKTHQKQSDLSIQEAHRLWSKTQTCYLIIDNIQILVTYTHDLDFTYILDKIKSSYEKQVDIFEKELNKYSLKSPEPSRTEVVSINKSEVMTDKFIARIVFSFLQLALSKCVKIIREIIFNDNIREILMEITREEVIKFFDFVKYMKIKGWIENPPLYPNNKSNDIVAANEIWELWDHLQFRYGNIQETKIYSSYTNDQEFQLILDTGIKILEKQTRELEKMLINYGVNLPVRHPKNIPTPESKENFDDKYMFTVILHKMMNASTIHGFALQELVINDMLMDLFRDLLFDEIFYIDKLIRYGKIKGWVTEVPVLRR